MESLFKENSNKVDNTRLLETDLGNMICYNENDTMQRKVKLWEKQ